MLSRLGEGGMGTVYLCEHAVLRRRFAVKVLRPELASDPELVDRFRNEAIAASRIGQENVVDVVDFGAEEDGALYYVMEALDGRSLGTVIRDEGPLRVPRALDVLEQLCRALAAAHARGVVHRDVKPDNVFLVLREDGTELAKVIDFGISHVASMGGGERLTRAGAIIGTPEYMAPEQAAGERVDHRADVYAAGVLAYEMMTGELPIEAATPIATLVAHQTRTPEPPSHRRQSIPREVDALVLRALAKKPEDRFASMEALAAEVARVRSSFDAPTGKYVLPRPSRPRGETVSLPESQAEVRRATIRARAAGGAAATLAIAAVVAAVGWFLVGRLGTETRTPGADSRQPTATSTSTATAPLESTPAHPEPFDFGAEGASAQGRLRTPAHPERSGGEAPTESKGAEAAARSRRAPTPTSTAPPTVAAPVLVEERPAAPPAAPIRERAKAKKAASPSPPSESPAPQDELKDPYTGDVTLKDPFR